jgi:hypothetical protein
VYHDNLRAVAAVASGRLPEMSTKMREAFVLAGERGSVTPIHMFYREWAVIVEIERDGLPPEPQKLDPLVLPAAPRHPHLAH